eukprot:365062-Chlamydomonas_euryale.AAC.7
MDGDESRPRPLPVPRPRAFPVLGDAPGPRCGHTLTAIAGPDGDLSKARLILFGATQRDAQRSMHTSQPAAACNPLLRGWEGMRWQERGLGAGRPEAAGAATCSPRAASFARSRALSLAARPASQASPQPWRPRAAPSGAAAAGGA